MSTTRKIQFVVEADEPALFFSSRRAAERYLEAVDIEAGVYPIAFDRSGLIYDVVSNGTTGLLIPNAAGKKDKAQLLEILTKFLVAVGHPPAGTEPLDQLLDECEPFLNA